MVPKLIRREPEDDETEGCVALVKGLEVGVLGGEAAGETETKGGGREYQGSEEERAPKTGTMVDVLTTLKLC